MCFFSIDMYRFCSCSFYNSAKLVLFLCFFFCVRCCFVSVFIRSHFILLHCFVLLYYVLHTTIEFVCILAQVNVVVVLFIFVALLVSSLQWNRCRGTHLVSAAPLFTLSSFPFFVSFFTIAEVFICCPYLTTFHHLWINGIFSLTSSFIALAILVYNIFTALV